ncbi:SAM-dependent methyltransferase [Mesonia ostreae]|uniref:SAM-dependent methyltransferase n=1 Tax=Mesonia ostreae TaxID=861110 RepID=A0ABU2KLF1_9FLAO|nr:SAM-dependent methyltransferase [Mesonia ostreae]MDT0295556.1 SAM-dependent methyltransferase [Mesonia ostreae]
MKNQTNTGKLYLLPAPLGEDAHSETMPISVKNKIEELNYYIAENEKTARRYIKKIASEKPQPELKFWILNKHTETSEIPSFLEACLNGNDMGLLSEAGCPGIADPGADVVRIAHEKGIQVVPLVGPSSILLTMMSSGMNGQNFAFHGYLPIDKHEKKQEIKRLERISLEQNQAQIFIETPYRNEKFFEDLKQNLHSSTLLCIGCDVTLTTEYIKTQTISQWKKTKPDLHKKPAIFIFQRE